MSYIRRMEFTVSTNIKKSAAELFNAWLDSDLHTQMTGGEAIVSDVVGQSFSAWDGYITGTNITLVPNQQIIQKWRTAEFTEQEEDSLLQVTFSEENGSTTVSIFHSNLPNNGMQYQQGWIDNYFVPMKALFEDIYPKSNS